MNNPVVDTEYPINAVSKLTGVSCHALRVWERRYGFPVPNRSASGHRRYGVDQVQLLKRISELTRGGQAIGDLIAAVKAGGMVLETAAVEECAAVKDDRARGDVSELLEPLVHGDVSGAEEAFAQLEARLSSQELIDNVIAAALTETGERWFRRNYSVFHERCVTEFLRRKLGVMIDAARGNSIVSASARSIMIGTVQGDRHEGGVLLAQLLLERQGWRVFNMGVDLPVAEYAKAIKELRRTRLALSFVLSRNINKRLAELSKLSGLPIFVGGRDPELSEPGAASRLYTGGRSRHDGGAAID